MNTVVSQRMHISIWTQQGRCFFLPSLKSGLDSRILVINIGNDNIAQKGMGSVPHCSLKGGVSSVFLGVTGRKEVCHWLAPEDVV